MDRDKPLKPIIDLNDQKYNKVGYYGCPNCRCRLNVTVKFKYCGRCGQRIDWEGIKDEKTISASNKRRV